jgi:hypothetical protein
VLKRVEGDLAAYLGSEQGVLVDQVERGGPAEKGGLKRGDILLSVNEQALTGPVDLMQALRSAPVGQARSLRLRRQGQEIELAVVPEPRPAGFKLELSSDLWGEPGEFRLEMFPLGKELNLFRFGDPAMIWVPSGSSRFEGEMEFRFREVDDDQHVTVRIVRKGGQPAEITIREGETETTYTEEQLGELPERIRRRILPWLMRSLGGPAWEFRAQELRLLQREDGTSLPRLADELRAQAQVRAQQAVEKHLEQAREQTRAAAAQAKAAVQPPAAPQAELEALRTMVEQLRDEVARLREALEDNR